MRTSSPDRDVVRCIRGCSSLRRSFDTLSVTLRAPAYPVLTANDFSRLGLHEGSRFPAGIDAT